MMRISIFEHLLNDYLFQSDSKEYSLYPFLDNSKKDKKKKKYLNSVLKFISEKFTEDFPLIFYAELGKEIKRLLKLDNLKELQFEKYILKMEFLLAWHFENNFMTKPIDNRLGLNFYGDAQMYKGRTNYVYSIECLNTIFKFLKVFEKQSLATRIENEFVLIHNLFCSEKIYYFYCDKLDREKIPSGNIVKYLLEQINTRVEVSKNSKTNNYDCDNFYLMNLYLINHIIQFYPFYFHRKPELVEILQSLKILKNFPYPVGHFCTEVMENTLNEIMFQGSTFINKFRQCFFLDMLDQKINILDVKYFRYTLIAYSYEWEKRHKNVINTEHPDGFNLVKFIDRLRNKQRSLHKQKLIIREVVLKLLITIIINSKNIYSDENFKKLYEAFMPNYKEIYESEGVEENKEDEEENEEEKEEKNEDEDNETKEKNINEKLLGNTQTKIKTSLDKLLKIIDIGLDKSIKDFDQEIDIMSKKLISMGGDALNLQNEENDDTILDNKAYLPINSLRNYMKPFYTDKKKLYKKSANEGFTNSSELNILDTYVKTFTYVVNNYFSYFLKENLEDKMVENNLKTLRANFYNNFRINILIIEEDNTINELLDNIQRMFSPEEINKRVSDQNFDKFWKFFIKKKTDIRPKFLIHLVPHYESDTKNPFRILSSNDDIDNNSTYLSEFIAANDYIYKTVIFMPFCSNADTTFFEYIPNCQTTSKNHLEYPTIDIMYSFLKKPLDYYIGDSNGILNLNIYKITVNEQNPKLFYKKIQFLLDSTPNDCKVTLQCVDYLGLEEKEDKIVELHNNFIINIFNLFYKKDVPFNYNMNSNNNWLEMFLDDKYEKPIYDDFCLYNNFVKTHNGNKFYEEFNMPETNIETRFKNFKVKKFILETNSANLKIKFDDNLDYDYSKLEGQGGSKDFKTKIIIEPYSIDEINYKLPVATFTTI